MTDLLKEHVAEALTGLLVVLVAVLFAVFAWNRTTHAGGEAYRLMARFPNVSGVSVGTDIRIAGMKVGTVTAQRFDPKTYQAVLTFEVQRDVQLPVDSSAAITSEGLLGGSFIALSPGGDTQMLRDGEEITETQGATDLTGLIGSFINRSGGSDEGGSGTAPAAEASPAQ